MAKLTGTAYLDYWRTRMAKGADQASFNGRDADLQGEQIWAFIGPKLSELKPRSVLDFGCGYGRMLKRIAGIWPEANLHGVDLCSEALESLSRDWPAAKPPKLSTSIPARLRVDLIFSCLALQHVTDDALLADIVNRFWAALNPSGVLVLFENVSCPGADHVRDSSAQDYELLWPDLKWTQMGTLVLGFQGHALMAGRKS